jgi:hypothetical protein
MDLEGEGVYKKHSIHACRLVSGAYAAAVVRLGAQGSVETVPGEYRSREEAVAAAKAHIDLGGSE